MDVNPDIITTNGEMWLQSGICKPLKWEKLEKPSLLPGYAGDNKHPFLTIHGNVQYDFLYRSFADTPFYQKDFRQHTIRTSLAVSVKDKYPLNVNLVLRKSNSPYFRDFFDGGAVFNRFEYNQNLKQQLLDKISKNLPQQLELATASDLLGKEWKKLNKLKTQLSAKGLLQDIIEEKEKKYYASLKSKNLNKPSLKTPVLDSLKVKADSMGFHVDSLNQKLANLRSKADSSKLTLQAKVDARKKQLDSLQDKINRLQDHVDSIRQKLDAAIALVKGRINNASNAAELRKIEEAYGVKDNKKGFESFVEGLKTIGIGRSVVNYSELTAKDVSVTGLNLEYNSRFYAAAAAGKVDYGFRGFFGRNTRSHNQYLVLGRIGAGNTEKKAVILTVYNGRKINYGYSSPDTVNTGIQVTGYSVETIFRKNQETWLSAEVAKSTIPVTGSLIQNKQMNSLFRFSDRTNLGVSAKGQFLLSATQTRFSGLFRNTGENFQSFSLFSYNSSQTAWMVRAEQPFFKDRVRLTGTVRKNDFINPFTIHTFKTSTVFGSIQAVARFRHWPTVSAGYYPGSQLYIVDQERVIENVYYILNASVVHQYRLGEVRMISSLIYNSYKNKGTDSGFISYAGNNYVASQSAYFRRWQLQGSFSYTDQEELNFYTTEGNAWYSFPRILKLGAGVKYNKVIAGGTYWGGLGEAIFDIPKVGSIQFQYDKSFLPTIQRNLFPVEIGRVTFIKTL